MLGVALHIYGDSIPEAKPELQKTEIINTANGKVELPVDEDDQVLSDYSNAVIENQEKDSDHEDAVDINQHNRKSYFATKIIKEMSDEERYQWNMKYIKKASTKDFTMKDWKRAIELARLQSEGITFTDSVTGETLQPDGKKELQRCTQV